MAWKWIDGDSDCCCDNNMLSSSESAMEAEAKVCLTVASSPLQADPEGTIFSQCSMTEAK